MLKLIEKKNSEVIASKAKESKLTKQVRYLV
jgi:hypothetical protein